MTKISRKHARNEGNTSQEQDNKKTTSTDSKLSSSFVQVPKTACGYVAIIGRPNVGKSTLLNRLLGQKISITSRKPQTTRHQILGVRTNNNTQAIFVDTPGLFRNPQHALNRYMVNTAIQALSTIDLVLFVIDGRYWRKEDEWILEKLKTLKEPIILVLNKVDQNKNKDFLLPRCAMLSKKADFEEIIPLSAKTGDNLASLRTTVETLLPENPYLFPEDQLSDRNERFFAAEMVREKLIRYTGDEVPYGLTVEIEVFKKEDKILHIVALIWVEKKGQKKIIVGKKGEGLKQIGTLARQDMEKFFEQKVFLELWVKVKENWSDNERAIQQLGYR